MKPFGTPHRGSAIRAMLLGSGELGKEVAIELQRLAVEVIAVDRYADAPAMQVAHRSHVINMLDGAEIRRLVALEQPDLIVPEIEAIDTATTPTRRRELKTALKRYCERDTWGLVEMVRVLSKR